ncbi:hypothetical protein K502DRAFT_363971 [Neoconidiobolus thromboides FSU 785]|nr:hypothetical protein K502DRAFT_363971 [Neoconidiobolus thromboides FSU 785]
MDKNTKYQYICSMPMARRDGGDDLLGGLLGGILGGGGGGGDLLGGLLGGGGSSEGSGGMLSNIPVAGGLLSGLGLGL